MHPPAGPDGIAIAAQAPPSLARAAAFWLKLGCIGFGGPAGQIAIMHEELVERRRWLSERRFLHALNFCMLLPGPEAQQLATYIGWLMHRTPGGLIAGLLFVLPSLLLLIALSWLYLAFGTLPLVVGLFYGIKPAVAALVLHAALRIGARTLRNPALWGVAVAAFAAIFAFAVPFPAIVAAAAAIGWVGGRMAPAHFAIGAGQRTPERFFGPALIDDDTPPPLHARPHRRRWARPLTMGLGLWLAPMTLLGLGLGWQHTLTQMGWFFSKAALLTFGGAYAVLPYVFQGAVEQYQWLTPAQMIDGLALGETTPGPLIMVVAFIGFVGAHTQALFGPDALFLAGAAGACLVTWFTFLPSFVFIFVGGPVVETTHRDIRLTAPLTAISAAVVGVIADLGVYFGYHVLWPAGFAGRFDPVAALIAIAAAMALWRGRCHVVLVIGAAAGIGAVLATIR